MNKVNSASLLKKVKDFIPDVEMGEDLEKYCFRSNCFHFSIMKDDLALYSPKVLKYFLKYKEEELTFFNKDRV